MVLHTVRTFTVPAALLLLLMATLVLTPMNAAYAAAPSQGAPAELVPLQLGEIVVEAAANGQTFDYEIAIPQDGVYSALITDEDEAVAFDLVVMDNVGDEVFNDVFGEIDLELAQGSAILHFEAVDNAELAFVIVSELGEMSDDIAAPGVLAPGGVYYNNDASEPLYAILTIFETDYPQQVTVYFEPGNNDGFTVSAEGADINFVEADSAQTDELQFFTHGGVFLVSAMPADRHAELTLIPFLSGAPDMLAAGATTEGSIPAGETAVIFALGIDEPYATLTVDVDSAADDVEVTMVDRLFDGDYIESSFGANVLTAQDVAPGVYYVIVETADALVDDLSLDVRVTGVEGEAIDAVDTVAEEGVIELLDGVGSAEGAIDQESVELVYWFEAEAPGSLVTVSLTSPTEGTDFDLRIGVNENEALWSTFESGSNDAISFVAPAAGEYYASVLREGGPGEFTLMVENTGLAPEILSGELTWGAVEAGAKDVYRYEVPEAGGLLSIALVSQDDVTLDISLAGFDEDGDTLLELAGLSIGQADIVAAPIKEAGIYEVVVSAEFSDGGDYVLLPRLDDPNFVARQWASGATASSQYSDDGYSAMQATGEPDTPMAGDYNTAWASAEQDAGKEYIELTYEHSVVPTAVNIHETYKPGAIIALKAYDEENAEWVILWDGEVEEVEEAMRVFSPDLVPLDFATNSIRIDLESEVVKGWNEIDAVELVGRP